MRMLALLAMAALLAGCWSPEPGPRPANRYPWDSKGAPARAAASPPPAPKIEAHGAIPWTPAKPTPGPAESLEAEQPQVHLVAGIENWHTGQRPPDGTYCVIALQPATTGIVISGNAGAVGNDCGVAQPHKP